MTTNNKKSDDKAESENNNEYEKSEKPKGEELKGEELKGEKLRKIILEKINGPKSVAPREIAEAYTKDGEDWRKILPVIKRTAIQLESENLLTFLRKGKPVPSKGLKGVYRLAKPETD